jgi:16S rRNA (guanine(527)-N(7))-methyltransferase RsmG
MFHVKHEGWEMATALGLSLGNAQKTVLEDFERLLLADAVPMGMIGPSDAPVIRERHVIDSLRGLQHLPATGRVGDLGSGAGLPGIPLAICRPDLEFVLVEVRKNRANFLRLAAERLRLANVSVYDRRLETLRERFDVCTARAFAPPTKTWQAAMGVLAPTGVAVYWAGTGFDASRDLPKGAANRLFVSPALARSGPLVIMARQ